MTTQSNALKLGWREALLFSGVALASTAGVIGFVHWDYMNDSIRQCDKDIRNAQKLNPDIRVSMLGFSFKQNQCSLELPNGQQAVWTPGSQPLNRNLELVPAQ